MFGWNMLPCLLIAGLLGAWIGWLLKSLLFGSKEKEYEGRLTDLENSWSTRWQTKSGEFDTLQTNFNSQTARLGTLDADYATTTANLKDRDALLLDWEMRYKNLAATGSAENTKDDAEIAELKAQLAKSQAAHAAELATANQSLTSKTAELATLAASVAALEGFRNKAGEWETKYKTDLGARDAELAKLNASVTDWEGRYKRLETASTAENSKDDQAIADLKGQLAKLQAELDAHAKTASVMDTELNTLRQNVAGKDADLAKLTASVAALEIFRTKAGEGETKYQTDIGGKDSEIGSLRAKITELEMLISAPKKPDWTDLVLIEGIGDSYYQKLSDIGISWQKELLRKGADKEGRQEIAAKSGIREDLVLTWVNHCDLRRVNGISEQFAELLEVAGVDTVVELATRRPDNLFTKLVEVNTEKQVAPATPIAEEVQSWVAQAKNLGRVVTHQEGRQG